MKRLLVTAACLPLVWVLSATAAAQVPTRANLAANVSDTNGPINGSVSLTVRVFDAASAGTMMFAQTINATAVDGLLYAELGASGNEFDLTVFDGGDRWLEFVVNGTTMSPRLQVGSVPYALKSDTADRVGNLTEADIAPVTHNHDGTYLPLGTSLSCSGSTPVVTGLTATGDVTCGADQSTTYSVAPGGGLVLSGTEFSIAAGGVTSNHVALNTLTAADLATDSVGRLEIATNAVASAEVVDNSLTSADLAANSVFSSEIATGAVGSSEVRDNSLTSADLAANSVTASEVVNGSLGAADIADVFVRNNGDVVSGPLTVTGVTSLLGGARLSREGTWAHGADVTPEVYFLITGPTCNSATRGRIFIAFLSGQGQDGLCACMFMGGTEYVNYCFNP